MSGAENSSENPSFRESSNQEVIEVIQRAPSDARQIIAESLQLEQQTSIRRLRRRRRRIRDQ
ncbi:hypothetical protein HK096_001793, partial [Nowakowskiella sp. JEL0078]